MSDASKSAQIEELQEIQNAQVKEALTKNLEESKNSFESTQD